MASEIADYLDELVYLEFQLSAVTTDMYMYLGWFADKKDWIKDASKEAVNDLIDIENHVRGLKTPIELIELREMNLQSISKLKDIYDGIEEKPAVAIKAEFKEFGGIYEQYSVRLKTELKKYRNIQELPQDFDFINEETKLITNLKDKDNYLQAIDLMKNKKYEEAYNSFSELRDKHADTLFEACVMLKISDCILRADSDIEFEDKLKGKENGLSILAEIISKDRYSPVLYEAFYKWRTTEQYYNHGMSNMSHIPNKEYNEKRWALVQKIKKHLINNSDDIWAQEQIDLLLSLPNIARGGPMGNHNLEHWGSLYVDLSKFKSEENKE